MIDNPCAWRRQGILSLAREMFLAHGYAETSMSAIAARVGGSKGTLYSYFSSKYDLFKAVIEFDCEQRQEALFENLEAYGDDIEAALGEAGRRYAAIILSDDVINLSRIVISQSVRFPELGYTLRLAGPERARSKLADYVREQVSAGRLVSCDVNRLVDQFLEMCAGSFLRDRLMNILAKISDDDINVSVDAAVVVIVKSYLLDNSMSWTTSPGKGEPEKVS